MTSHYQLPEFRAGAPLPSQTRIGNLTIHWDDAVPARVMHEVQVQQGLEASRLSDAPATRLAAPDGLGAIPLAPAGQAMAEDLERRDRARPEVAPDMLARAAQQLDAGREAANAARVGESFGAEAPIETLARVAGYWAEAVSSLIVRCLDAVPRVAGLCVRGAELCCRVLCR